MKPFKIFLATCVALPLMGMGRVDKDLSNDPIYAPAMGNQYRTKMDYAVYSSRDAKQRMVISRLNQDFPPKERIRPPFPIKHYGSIIYGILPANSEFKVVKVKQEGSSGMNFTRLYVEITKSSDPQWIGKVVYPSGMTDYDNQNPVPKFKPEYVEELPPTP